MPRTRTEIEFIHSPYSQAPGVASTASTASQRRRVHSHAAREAHAKVRRQRLIEYQAARTGSEDEKKAFAAEVETPLISSPVGLLATDRRDPFGSFARRLNSTEDFLLDYYMQDVVPCSKLQRNRTNRPGVQDLNKQFVQLAFTNSNSLDGLFLVACRHLSQCLSQCMPHKGPYFIQLALQYKIACTQSLREAISCLDMQSSISNWIVGLALFLAQDEVLAGDVSSTQTHIQGAIQMTRHNGALNKTDLGAFPYDLIRRDIAGSVR